MSELKIPPEIEKALEENSGYRNSVRGLQKLTQRFCDSARANAEATNAVSLELNKVISDDWVKSSPSLDIAKYFRYFSTTVKAVGCVQEKLAKQVEDEVSEPLANFVDYDFLATAELRKKVSQTQSEYESTCGKIENVLTQKKKSRKAVPLEQQIQEFEKSLERLKGELDLTTEELASKQEELSHKKETKVLRYMLQLLVLEYEYHQKSFKLLSNLKPKMDTLAALLQEGETQVSTYKEGHLNRKTQAIGSGWQKCFYVLKEGQLYCYKGKKDTQVDQSFNVMLCTTRVDHKKKDLFEIVTPDKKKPIVLQAETQVERDSWVKAINSAISESLNAGSAIGFDKRSRAVKKEVTDQKFYRIVSPIAGNLRCADCAQAGPDWASINLGILVCLECSGVHRSLGTHITKVRSMTLDTKSWEPELLCLMRNVGNERFNARFEAHIPSDVAKPRKTSDRDSRERFIKAKYVDKKFFEWPPETDRDFLSAELYNKVATTDDQCLELLTLIAAGADVNWKHPQDEDKGPLHAAVIFDKVVYIELLIQNGADIFQTAARKWTPMHFAAYYQRVHCAAILCKHGFNKRQLEFRTDQNKTAVEIAFNADCQDIISLLRDEPVSGLTPTVEDLEELAFQEALALEEKDGDSGLLLSEDIPELPDIPLEGLPDPDDDDDYLDEVAALPLPTPPPATPPPTPALPPTATVSSSPVPLARTGSLSSSSGNVNATRPTSLSGSGRGLPPPTAPLPAPLPVAAAGGGGGGGGGGDGSNRSLLYEMRQNSNSKLASPPPPIAGGVPLPIAVPVVGGPPPLPTRPSSVRVTDGAPPLPPKPGEPTPPLPPRE